MTAKVVIVIQNSDGEIRMDATLGCTFKQLADALESALTSGSFTTLQINPVGQVDIKRRVVAHLPDTHK